MRLEDDYENLVDESEDLYEDQKDLQEEQLAAYGTYPQVKEKSDLYNWFWKVVQLGTPKHENEEETRREALRMSKVGNLNNKEIGEYSIPVRDALNLAELGNIFHHPKFGNYWQNNAVITAATSMSKQGWFMDLSISQKKVRERTKKATSSEAQKWRLFNRDKQPQQQQGE